MYMPFELWPLLVLICLTALIYPLLVFVDNRERAARDPVLPVYNRFSFLGEGPHHRYDDAYFSASNGR